MALGVVAVGRTGVENPPPPCGRLDRVGDEKRSPRWGVVAVVVGGCVPPPIDLVGEAIRS